MFVFDLKIVKRTNVQKSRVNLNCFNIATVEIKIVVTVILFFKHKSKCSSNLNNYNGKKMFITGQSGILFQTFPGLGCET